MSREGEFAQAPNTRACLRCMSMIPSAAKVCRYCHEGKPASDYSGMLLLIGLCVALQTLCITSAFAWRVLGGRW